MRTKEQILQEIAETRVDIKILQMDIQDAEYDIEAAKKRLIDLRDEFDEFDDSKEVVGTGPGE